MSMVGQDGEACLQHPVPWPEQGIVFRVEGSGFRVFGLRVQGRGFGFRSVSTLGFAGFQALREGLAALDLASRLAIPRSTLLKAVRCKPKLALKESLDSGPSPMFTRKYLWKQGRLPVPRRRVVRILQECLRDIREAWLSFIRTVRILGSAFLVLGRKAV